MPATSKGRIHDVFVKRLKDRTTHAQEQAAAARSGSTLRPWNVPDEVGDPLQVAAVTAGFDRGEIDSNFEEIIADGSNPGTVGDTISVKVQGDVVAVMERGFRARHCTPVRLMAMAAARRQGHGNERGVFNGGILKYAQDALKAGQG